MKTKNILIILFFAGIVFTACVRTSELMTIHIQNDTDSPIHVRLFPKEKYLYDSNRYNSREGSENIFAENEFLLGFEGNRRLFLSFDLTVEPYTLVKNVFDSIYISTESKDHVIIKFTHDTAIGYSENIFTENSIWNLRIEEIDLGMNGSTKRNIYYHYTFLIEKDNLIIEKEEKP
jgi:hypothetical protein